MQMIWLSTTVYFLIFSIIIWFGFCCYGITLQYFGKCGFVTKKIGGIIIYLIFSCLLVSPLFIAFSFFEYWLEEFRLNPVYMIYFITLFLSSAVPGGMYFKNNYLNNLRRLEKREEIKRERERMKFKQQ